MEQSNSIYSRKDFGNILNIRQEAGNAVEIACFFDELPMPVIDRSGEFSLPVPQTIRRSFQCRSQGRTLKHTFDARC